MTIASVITQLSLLFGPTITSYFIFELSSKQDGHKTLTRSFVANLLCQAIKLTLFAFILPIFTSNLEISSQNVDSSSMANHRWIQVIGNTVIGSVIDSMVISQLLQTKSLMNHTPHRVNKIFAVALGWTLGNLLIKSSLTSLAQLFMIFFGHSTE